jgi:hypothetical protein
VDELPLDDERRRRDHLRRPATHRHSHKSTHSSTRNHRLCKDKGPIGMPKTRTLAHATHAISSTTRT